MEARRDYHTTPEQIQAMYAELDGTVKQKAPDAAARFGAIAGRVVFIAIAVALCALIACIWIARYKGETPTLFGFQFYSVETPSMEPTLPVGSVILTKKLTDDIALDVGDVITFHYKGSFVTHRIIEYYTDDGVECFRTKGDNPENSIDPWVLHREDIEALLLRKLW